METLIEIERSPQSNFHIILLLTPGSPMDSCHPNPSPSDPMESVLRVLIPHLTKAFLNFSSSNLKTQRYQS